MSAVILFFWVWLAVPQPPVFPFERHSIDLRAAVSGLSPSYIWHWRETEMSDIIANVNKLIDDIYNKTCRLPRGIHPGLVFAPAVDIWCKRKVLREKGKERKKKREEDSCCLHIISHLTKRLDDDIAGLLVDMQCLTMMYDDLMMSPLSLRRFRQTDKLAGSTHLAYVHKLIQGTVKKRLLGAICSSKTESAEGLPRELLDPPLKTDFSLHFVVLLVCPDCKSVCLSASLMSVTTRVSDVGSRGGRGSTG